jgi:hypothetical protein
VRERGETEREREGEREREREREREKTVPNPEFFLESYRVFDCIRRKGLFYKNP